MSPNSSDHFFFNPCSSSECSKKIFTNLSNVTSTSFPLSGRTLGKECSFLTFLTLSFTSKKKKNELLKLSVLKFSRLKIEITMVPTIVWNIPSKLIGCLLHLVVLYWKAYRLQEAGSNWQKEISMSKLLKFWLSDSFSIAGPNF